MSLDRWLDEGFGGEARRRYEERLSSGRRSEARRQRTPEQEAELAQVEREAAELRERLGLNQTLTDQ